MGLTVTSACNFGGMPTLVGAVCVSSPVGLGSPTRLDANSSDQSGHTAKVTGRSDSETHALARVVFTIVRCSFQVQW